MIDVNQNRFDRQHSRNEKLCCDRSYDGGRGAAATSAVGNNIHNLAENVRVHGEERAKEHHRPAQLRRMIQPTAEHENQQISGLVQDVEWWILLQTVTRKVVNRGEGDEP